MSTILLEMALAALPRDAREASGSGGAQSGIIIDDDEGGAVEAALLERAQKVAPVDLSFTQGGGDAEDPTLAGGIDADGDQHGAIEHDAIAADLFITGIEDEIG